MKHTPLPWRLVYDDITNPSDYAVNVVSDDTCNVIVLRTSLADADLIVQAVNSLWMDGEEKS